MCLLAVSTHLLPSRWRSGSMCPRWAEPWDTHWQIYSRWAKRATEEPGAKNTLCLKHLLYCTNELSQSEGEKHDQWKLFRVVSLCLSWQIRKTHNRPFRAQSALQTEWFYTGYYPKTQSCIGKDTHPTKHCSYSWTYCNSTLIKLHLAMTFSSNIHTIKETFFLVWGCL